ncbi:MAG: CapA family protein [Chloroflexi bacterium]|nr:CapA family protein [Chloroflexota bacterium]
MPLYDSESGDITMLLTGESLISRRMSVFKEPSYLKMVELLRSGDVTFTNAEMLFHNYETSPNPHQQGTYMRADPAIIKELQWLGINIVACANNHAYDYGEGGVLKNIENLNAAGLAHAGSGRNLAEAREPAYMDTNAGRVALIACTDSGPAEGRAGEQRRDMQGRPGVSWLRTTTEYVVDRPTFDALHHLSQQLGFEQRKQAQEFKGDSDTVFHLMGLPMYSPVNMLRFTLGERFGFHRIPDQYDMDGIIDRVKDARRMADWVIVTMHNHEGGPTGEDPGDHWVALAKNAINAGADVVTGHGPHRDRGIEIYNGKPIFYSLGDFCMENDTVLRMPHDNYLRQGLGWEGTPAQFFDARSKNETAGMPANQIQWEATMVKLTVKDRKLGEIRLYPLDLGFKRSRGTRGRPMPATGEVAKTVLERMQSMSKKYGTDIRIDGETAAVRL